MESVIAKNNIIQYVVNNIKESGKNPTRVISGFIGAWVLFSLNLMDISTSRWLI